MDNRATTTHYTLCRICEAHCGLEVDTVSGSGVGEEVVAVRPDKQHPASEGYACIKGTSLGRLHHDPARLNYPQKKVNGRWQRISWEQAIAEIGEQVYSLQSEYGQRCIAHYTGNPTFFSSQNLLFSEAFLKALGSPNLFASHSIDVNNKFHVSTEVFGNSLLQPIPDIPNCEFFLCLGSNPQASQMSVVSQPHAMRSLKGVQARGGRVLVIDPRRTETASKIGDHAFIKPGTDAYLLLGVLHVLMQEMVGFQPEDPYSATGLKEFLKIADGWTPERTAAITGLSAEFIREIAQDYVAADGGIIYLSTGVNMGPFGSIAFWLALGLSYITGNLDRPGGLRFGAGPFDTLRVARMLGVGGFDAERTLVSGWHRVAGAFPVAALEEEICSDHPQRIRALFVSAGNPLHSVPGNQLASAFDRLSLKVAIDIYMSETAAQCDYVLPATDMLERADFPLSHANLQIRPHACYAPAVVAPAHERRQEWEIFSDLALACRAPVLGKSILNPLPRINRLLSKFESRSPLPLRKITPEDVIAGLLWAGGQVRLADLKAKPRGGQWLRALPKKSLLRKKLHTTDGRIQLAPERLMNDLSRLQAWETRLLEANDEHETQGTLQIIGRRERRSHNSWFHNTPGIKHESGNVAIMHPEDAAKRKLESGDTIRLKPLKSMATSTPEIRLSVKVSDEIMPGVLAVPHGWGHHGAGAGKAKNLPGGNINQVLPNVADHIEPVSGQAIMLGHSLRVERS